MLNINYIIPYHSQYHRPQITSPSKKDSSDDSSKKTFQDILIEKMGKTK